MKDYSQDVREHFQKQEPTSKLKKVVIEIENTSPEGTFVTVTNASTIKKLFDTIYALPKMPKDLACTIEIGNMR